MSASRKAHPKRVDQNEESKKGQNDQETPFISYLETFIKQQKMIEDEKLDQEEALQQAKTVSNTLTKSFGEYKQAYLMN